MVENLATGKPVDLADMATGVNTWKLSLVLAAIAHAGGSHDHCESVFDPPERQPAPDGRQFIKLRPALGPDAE